MRLTSTAHLERVRFDQHGLLPVIAQHANTGEVLTLAYANREAIERTLRSSVLWLYSRSRQALWQKGESSGNLQHVVELHLDCDADALLARVLPAGPACHTGERSCFGTAPTLQLLADIIAQRAQQSEAQGYTARLLSDSNLRLKKLGEEATELALACQSGSAERITSEAADLLYHVLVATAAENVDVVSVLRELEKRMAKTTGVGKE
ncbi:MAG: bifunctional phosphoribosyl-AMP cyclohydrolase/phosphoribosyl-ATP diphosphatase HisIE [Gemmatimonadota bacterium]